MDEDVVQVDATDIDDTTNSADDAETLASQKKGGDGDNIIAILIG